MFGDVGQTLGSRFTDCSSGVGHDTGAEDCAGEPMSAVIIPFPAARRVDLVHSIARRALELTPVDGERHIERSLATQATVLRRKGVSQADIDRNLTGLCEQ